MVAQPGPGSANRPYARSRGSAHLPLLPSPFTSSSALLLAQLRLAQFTFAAMGAPPGPQQGIEQGAAWSTSARAGWVTALPPRPRVGQLAGHVDRDGGAGTEWGVTKEVMLLQVNSSTSSTISTRVRHPRPQAKLVDMLLLGLGSCLLCGATVLVLVDGLDGFSCTGCPSCSCHRDGLDGLGCHRARARVERAE